MSVHNGSLNRRRLDQVLRHMSRAQVGAASLGSKLGLDIDAFLEEDTFQERVFVSEHQTLIGGGAVSRLEVVEVGLMDTDGLFELLYIFGTTLSEGGLGLPVALLAFLGRGVDGLAATLPLGLLSLLGDGIGVVIEVVVPVRTGAGR